MIKNAVHLVALSSALLLGACGSQGSGTTPATGGAGGAAGASGGSGGVGGTGASGGSSGTGASGGSGGVASGLCAKIQPLTCFSGDCEQALAATTQQATTAGCKLEAQAAFDCIQTDTPFCDPQKLQVQYSSACQSAIDAYNACLAGGSNCTVDGFIGPCVLLCGSSWAAECSLAPGDTEWSCDCRSGPKAGTKFTAQAVDKCSEAAMALQCAP